ncbi:MAG: nucleotide exchange factor GrpE [Patescibacteria group bacterium]|nr:nucleotide exchange factor GrpE [Patescibacteria group bacterium]
MNEEKQNQNEKEKKQQETVDYKEKWKRALADYRNLEKRVVKERETLVRFSNRDLILKLLPVLDDLEEAVKKSDDEGYEKILSKLKEVLREAGLEEIDVKGKEFDPSVMEGVQREDTAGETQSPHLPAGKAGSPAPGAAAKEAPGASPAAGEKKIVNKVVRKGYNLHGKLLRPARVVVGNSKS